MNVSKQQKVVKSRNGVENKDMNMSVCKEQQVEESHNVVENKESVVVCEEQQATENVKRMEKKIVNVFKRQRVQKGEAKLVKKNEMLKQKEECVENEMTDDDKSAFAVVTEALRTFYKYYLHFVQVYNSLVASFLFVKQSVSDTRMI